MEKYKKGIKNRVMIGKAYIVILVAFVLLSRFYNLNIGGGGFTEVSSMVSYLDWVL